MTWKELLTQQRAAREPSSKEELAELRPAAEQALRDASVPGLSEWRRRISILARRIRVDDRRIEPWWGGPDQWSRV